MNKNLIYSIIVVVLLGLGLWWIVSRTTPQDALSPTSSPVATASAIPTPSSTPVVLPITITSPKANAVVDSPILVTGTARVFENQFMVQVKDSNGKVVAQVPAMTDAKDVGLFGNYQVRVQIPPNSATQHMTVEALAYSPKGDGSLVGDANVPVTLKYTDVMNVYAAYLTSNDCATVSLFPRNITKTSQFVLSSVLELLKGPVPAEVLKNTTTMIPSGVVVNSLQTNENSVTIDFNSAIDQGVTAGSCKAQSITAQIVGTIKQFLGINTVVITVNGHADGILQP